MSLLTAYQTFSFNSYLFLPDRVQVHHPGLEVVPSPSSWVGSDWSCQSQSALFQRWVRPGHTTQPQAMRYERKFAGGPVGLWESLLDTYKEAFLRQCSCSFSGGDWIWEWWQELCNHLVSMRRAIPGTKPAFREGGSIADADLWSLLSVQLPPGLPTMWDNRHHDPVRCPSQVACSWQYPKPLNPIRDSYFLLGFSNL